MVRIVLLAAAVALPRLALADHDHHHHHEPAPDAASPGSTLAATLSLTAAGYTNIAFVGDYQGVEAGARWARGRWSVMASIPAYRLVKNGATYHGPGDLMGHAAVTLLEGATASAGIALPVSVPTGSQRDGLGMGHVMLMPAAWGSLSTRGLTIGASVGYGRALGGDAEAHQHGTGPLVDPMNFEELTYGGSVDLAVAKALRVGARLSGAIALDDGVDRLIGGVRAIWTEGRVTTGAELQVGLDGDPFNVRGVVETALAF